MAFIDFAEIKERVSFTDAVELLSLELKQTGNQWRGQCPCGGGERSLVITDGKGFFCFNDKKGGDVIGLAAHVLKLGAKEAAQELAKRAGMVQESTSTSKGTLPAPKETEGLQPLAYLDPEHDAVVAIGFDTSVAKALGIGYASKGMMRGTVAVPIRDESGTLRGYIGIEEAKLPPDFQTNIVPFKKTA